MNRLPVYLYSNLLEVILDLDHNKGIHQIMYQRKLKVQKGFKDSIQIQFKNSDQKPVALSNGLEYYFDIIDTDNRQLLVSKQMEILDDSSVFNVSVNQTEVSNLLVFDDTTGITVGQSVYGFGIPANTMIIAVTPTTVTLNRPTLYPVTTASDLTINTLNLRGVAKVTFDPQDTIDLVASSYTFIVKQANADGTFTPIYSNTYYGITGEIEIVEDGFPLGYPIQTVTMKEIETGKDYDRTFGNMGYIFRTGWLRPVVRPVTYNTTSSAQFTLASFVGEITVEGTLDNNVSGTGSANAQSTVVTSFSTTTVTHGIITLEWSTPYTAVRFKVRPKNDAFGVNYYPTGNPIGSNNNKFPNGFVDSIQYFS